MKFFKWLVPAIPILFLVLGGVPVNAEARGKKAAPMLTQEKATQKAVNILMGDPYGSTPAAVRQAIESSRLSESGDPTCDITQPVWIFHVVVKETPQNSGFDGYLMLDARTGKKKCATLPFLD